MSKLSPALAAGGPVAPVSVSGSNLTWVVIVAVIALLALGVACVLVRLNRPGAGLANREAYLVEQ